MITSINKQGAILAAALLLGAPPLCFAPKTAQAAVGETLLASFNGNDDDDGMFPSCTLAQDVNGVLYGTTSQGGNDYGTTFQLLPNGNLVNTYAFPYSSTEGVVPVGPVILDASDTMYGIVEGGAGFSMVYALHASGEFDALHTFSGGSDGTAASSVILAHDGMLYGCSTSTIYRVNPDGSDYQILYEFEGTSDPDGDGSYAPLTQALDGSFYGVSSSGGVDNYGTLFKFTTPAKGVAGYGTLTVLHSFGDGSVANDGVYPTGYEALQRDASGNLYGDTEGGVQQSDGSDAPPVVFKYSASGKYTIVHHFASTSSSRSGLLLASDGNLYGVQEYDNDYMYGFAYRVSPAGSYSEIYYFNSKEPVNTDAEKPDAALLEDNDGNLIGSTPGGLSDSNRYGTVYKLFTRLVRLSTLTTSAASVPTGSSATGTVTLNAAARQAGTTIVLTSSNTKAATVPASVRIAPGKTSVAFPITTAASATTSSVTIKAAYNGQSLSTAVTVTAPTPSSVSLSPSSTVGGSAATTANRVSLTGNAAANTTITLTSSNTAVATVPANITIPSGSSSQTFTLETQAVTTVQTVTITATENGVSQSATLTVTPASTSAGLKSVTLSPTSTEGGTSTTANRVYWTGNAPANETVTLKSSNTAVATVPSSVTISSGSSSHAFTITTKAVTSQQTVTITAISGGASQTAALTVTP